MRWILIVLLMCNGIYFLWQNYLLQNDSLRQPLPTTSINAGSSSGLILLSEVSDADAPKLNSSELVDNSVQLQESAPTEEDVDQQEPALCMLIGPFKEEVSGMQMVSRMASLDIDIELQKIELPGKPDYWVHMPPEPSRRAAIKLLREMQAKGIDSFLITEGELENGISLGFFTEQPRADKVHQQRVKEGFEAQIKIVPRVYTEIWALLGAKESDKFSDALWEKIKEGDDRLQRRKNYCDKIASPDNFD